MSRILALNKNEVGYLIIGCIAAAINGAVQPIFSILFSEMVDLFYRTPEGKSHLGKVPLDRL